jgi:DnaK suppressor protein
MGRPAHPPQLRAPWHPRRVTKQESVSGLLAAERADTLERLHGLERELSGIIESSGSAGTDDEHDPEGATIAFERQHVAALLNQARRHLAQIDAAMLRLAECSYGRCESCGQDRRRAPPSAESAALAAA